MARRMGLEPDQLVDVVPGREPAETSRPVLLDPSGEVSVLPV